MSNTPTKEEVPKYTKPKRYDVPINIGGTSQPDSQRQPMSDIPKEEVPKYTKPKRYDLPISIGGTSHTVKNITQTCWSGPVGIVLAAFVLLGLAAFCAFIWVIVVRIDDADNNASLNAELLSNTRILEVINAFARTVTRQDWEANVELFGAGSTIDYHRVMSFLTGGPNLPADTTTVNGWGQQLNVFAGGFTSNHMLLSNCNISYVDPITANVVCTGVYTYSLRYSTSVSTINYPTQLIVFQSLFDMVDAFAHNEWIITNAVALVNATATLLNSIETGVAPPGAVTTKRHSVRFDIATWQTLLAQIAQLVDVGQIDTALAICRTPQYLQLKQAYDPSGTDPDNKCNTESPMPVTFTSPVMCTENGMIDVSCFNGTDSPVGIPDRIRTINMITPQPSLPVMPNSLDFTITGGTNVAVTGGMHGITLDVLAVTSVDLIMPTDVYAIAGSPVTANGTIEVTFVDQLQGYVFAGPPSGSGAPTFRVLALTELSGTLSVLNGGTGNNATYDPNRFIVSNSDGSVLTQLSSLDTGFFYVGTGIGTLPAAGTLIAGDRIIINMAGASFVISGEIVLLAVPADLFQDVSFNETLAFEVIPQQANYVWAGPESGGPGLPAFRALVAEDIPPIDLADAARVTGTLGVANGGTNNAGPYVGERVIMTATNGTSLVEGTLIGINGISISNGPGAYVIFDGAGIVQGVCNGGCGAVNATDVFCNAYIQDACVPPRIRLINGISPSAYPILDFSILAGTGVSITPGTSSITVSSTGVTSVSLALPASTFSITVVTVTTTGTLTATFVVQAANVFFAGPSSGPAAVPTWRLIDFGDLPPGNNGDVYYVSGGVVEATPLSLKLEVPSAEFSVSGSPITNPNGTFTITLNTQAANRFWAGPTTGAAAQPAFREIDLEDFTPLALTDGELLIGSTGGAPMPATLTAGPNIVISNAGGFIMIEAIVPAELTTLVAGTGINIYASGNNTVVANTGVTSVGLSLPVSIFSIDVSPVTTTGTLTASFLSQSASLFFASPSGASGVPTMRGIALADMPALADGQLYIGNGGVPVATQLTAGTLISITPGMGTVTVGSSALGSITLNMPTAIFDVASVAGTNTQTLTVTFDTQTANTVFAGPTTGIAAVPTMRVMVAADIPSLDASKITTGTLAIARGGTNSGTALLNGKLMFSNAGAIIEGTSATSPVFTTMTLNSNPPTLIFTNSGGSFGTTRVVAADPGSVQDYTLTIPNPTVTGGGFVIGRTSTQSITDTAASGEVLVATAATTSNWRTLTAADVVGGALSIASATLSATTNQLILGTTNRITISSTAPATSRTYTLHDAGAAANFVLSVGTAQTISDTAASGDVLVATSATASNWRPLVGSDIGSGTPTFTSATLSATTNQLILGTTNRITISSTAPATSRTYTLHDAGAAANFVLSVGTAQTISNTAASGDVLVATAATTSNWRPLTTADLASGTLSIARGGTNSGTALTNGNIMVSSAGAIVEGTSSTTPTFTTLRLSQAFSQLALASPGGDTIINAAIGGGAHSMTIPTTYGANGSFLITTGNQVTCSGSPSVGYVMVGVTTVDSIWRALIGSDISAGLPSFLSATLSATTNQLILGTTNRITISSTAPATSRTYTLHDAGAAANFVLSVGTAQTISDTAAAGEYLVATSATASNWAPLAITNQFAESSTNITGFSTSTYTTVTSMTFSLTAGTYFCSFSTVILASDTAGVDIAIHLNGVINSSSARTITTATTASVHSQAQLVPGGSLTADVQWRKTGGGTVDMYARNFYCMKVG